MRKWFTKLSIVLCLVAVSSVFETNPVAAADSCEQDSALTLTGVADILEEENGEWTIIPMDGSTKPCHILFLYGFGTLPDGCAKLEKFTATGTIGKGFATTELHVQKITCN